MIVVLGVYAVGVYTFVSRSVSRVARRAAARRLLLGRGDGGRRAGWPASCRRRKSICCSKKKRRGCRCGAMTASSCCSATPKRCAGRCLDSAEARRSQQRTRSCRFRPAGAPIRVMSGRSYVCPCVEDPQTGTLVGKRRVTVQVARSEEAMRQQLRDLLLILVLGLPLAVGDRRARRLHAGPSRAGADRADDRAGAGRSPPSVWAIGCRWRIPRTRWGGWPRSSTRRWAASKRRSIRCGVSRPTSRTSCARR